MKQFLVLLLILSFNSQVFGAGSDSSNGDSSEKGLYDQAVKLVKRAGKLEKKDKADKANERLAVLKNCNCEEYSELELIIKTRGTKIY